MSATERSRRFIMSIQDCVRGLLVKYTLILHWDNASNFKCAEHFYDIQEELNSSSMNNIHVYGEAGHRKSEVDSCGGHLKNPPWKHIAKGDKIEISYRCLQLFSWQIWSWEVSKYNIDSKAHCRDWFGITAWELKIHVFRNSVRFISCCCILSQLRFLSCIETFICVLLKSQGIP